MENMFLVRDKNSGAVINKNNQELLEYKTRKKLIKDVKTLTRRVAILEEKLERLIEKE